MQFSDEFLERWEHIIDDVDITDVPLECIKKVIVKLHGKKQRTINLDLLRRQGLDIEEIETVMTRTLTDLGEQVRDRAWCVPEPRRVSAGESGGGAGGRAAGERTGEHVRVEAVEQPAVAGQQRAGVFDAGAALHPAFEEVEIGRAHV